MLNSNYTSVYYSGTPLSGHPSPEDTLSIMDNFVGPNGVRLREVPLFTLLRIISLNRETLEKGYPRKLAQRIAQLSPEEKRAITDQKHSSSTTHQQIDPENAIVLFGCVCIFGLIAIVSENFYSDPRS